MTTRGNEASSSCRIDTVATLTDTDDLELARPGWSLEAFQRLKLVLALRHSDRSAALAPVESLGTWHGVPP